MLPDAPPSLVAPLFIPLSATPSHQDESEEAALAAALVASLQSQKEDAARRSAWHGGDGGAEEGQQGRGGAEARQASGGGAARRPPPAEDKESREAREARGARRVAAEAKAIAEAAARLQLQTGRLAHLCGYLLRRPRQPASAAYPSYGPGARDGPISSSMPSPYALSALAF